MLRWTRPRVLVVLCSFVVAAGTIAGDAFMESRKRQRREALTAGVERIMPEALQPVIFQGESLKRSLPLGALAPGFKLLDVADGRPVELAALRQDKPVVMILGSFGCDVICRQLPRLVALHELYRDRAHFLFVYVAEGPHKNLLPPAAQPEDRTARVRRGLRHYGIRFPCLVDTPDHVVQNAYNGYPMRVLVVDRDGYFDWDSGSIFHPLDLHGLEEWLQQHPLRPTRSSSM